MDAVKELSVEQLLKIRYKVIADYPASPFYDRCIITLSDIERQRIEEEYFYDKYPHLFKKLEWWEFREPTDMPEYAKDIQTGLVGKVFRILERGLCIGYRDNAVNWANCLPATEQEYNAYQSLKQKV